MKRFARLLLITVVFFFASGIARVSCAPADSEGMISLIAPDGSCVVDGDFTKTFKKGDPVEISKFNMQFASGVVEQVFSSYMVVSVKKWTPDYFVEVGDFVHKPRPKEKEKISTLRAVITPETLTKITTSAEQPAEEQGKILSANDEMVVKTNTSAGKTGDSLEKLLYERGKKGGYLSSSGSEGGQSAKQGRIIGLESIKENSEQEEPPKAAPAEKKTEAKASSRRRQKAVDTEE